MPDHNNSTSRFHGLPNEVSQSPRAWAPSATSTAAPGLAATYDGQLWAARPQIIKATFVEGNLLEIIISLRIFVKRRSPPNFQRNTCLLTVVLLPSLHVQQSHFRESSVSKLEKSQFFFRPFVLTPYLLFSSFNPNFFCSTTWKSRKICITTLPRNDLYIVMVLKQLIIRF